MLNKNSRKLSCLNYTKLVINGKIIKIFNINTGGLNYTKLVINLNKLLYIFISAIIV